MIIDVLQYVPKPYERTHGFVTLIYNDLQLTLRIRQYKAEKFFVELPKIIMGPIAYLPIKIRDKAVSDEFQKEVLRQIHEKWPNSLALKEYVDKNN